MQPKPKKGQAAGHARQFYVASTTSLVSFVAVNVLPIIRGALSKVPFLLASERRDWIKHTIARLHAVQGCMPWCSRMVLTIGWTSEICAPQTTGTVTYDVCIIATSCLVLRQKEVQYMAYGMHGMRHRVKQYGVHLY